jgi:hypothetical protein
MFHDSTILFAVCFAIFSPNIMVVMFWNFPTLSGKIKHSEVGRVGRQYVGCYWNPNVFLFYLELMQRQPLKFPPFPGQIKHSEVGRGGPQIINVFVN